MLIHLYSTLHLQHYFITPTYTWKLVTHLSVVAVAVLLARYSEGLSSSVALVYVSTRVEAA